MEQKVKKRTWVKDVAIIFLAVMLVLTFFSNTILNRSLPEAANALVQPGTIDSKVRISGTVEARENYDVTISQSRKVASVAVKLGQEVSTGDVLFTLEPGDSDELDSAREALHALELQYQKALINADNNDYAREKRNIELAKADLERAQAKYDSYALTKDELTALEKSIESAESQVRALERSVEAAQTGMNNSSDGSGFSGGGASNAMNNAVAEAQNRLSVALNDFNAAKLAYGPDFKALVDAALAKIIEDHPELSGDVSAIQRVEGNAGLPGWPKEAPYTSYLPFYLKNMAASAGEPQKTAYEKITAAESAYTAAQEALRDAQAAVNDANSNVTYDPGTTYQGKSHAYWVQEYNKLKPQLEDAQVILDSYKLKKTNYTESYTALDAAEEKLRNLQDALEDAQKADRLEAIDLQELLRQIQVAKEDVEDLAGGDTATEVKAKVNGIVQSLSVSAGHTAKADEILATIEVPDLGFTMTASVTNEQARLLHVGDSATVSNFYWGADTTATISAIRPDPQNPRSGKIVMFDITGDTAAGSTLNFAIGARSANYDYVVPNSAVRSDTNGKFVLIITAKNSPLGNRYYATRVDVEVLASDEHNSAISGELEGMSTVITATSGNAPIENGDQVRLPDDI